MPPVDSKRWERDSVRECADEIRTLMEDKLADLDARVKRPAV